MQEITFDELSTLKQPSASLRTALDKISAALGSVGDAGQQARSVVDELRVSLRAAAVQSVKSARSLAKFDEINRLSAPAEDKTAAPEKQKKAAAAAAKAEKAARSTTGTAARRSGTAGSDLSGLTAVWQSVLESLRSAWADFWAYLQEFFAPFAAAWQTVWQGLSAAAAGVWEQLCAALSTVVQPALALLDTVWQGLWAGMEQAWAAYGQPILDGLAQGWQNVVGIVSALWSEVLQPVLVQLFDSEDTLYSLLNAEPFLTDCTAVSGYIYEDGSFQAYGTNVSGKSYEYQLGRYVKGAFSEVTLNIGSAEDYEEWIYTTSRGDEVQLSLGSSRCVVMSDQPKAFVAINLLGGTEGNSFFMPEPVTKEDLEAFAELFDFAKLG